MPIPEDAALRIGRWCTAQSPSELSAQLRIECEIADRDVTIFESRPPWDGRGDWTRSPIARLRFTGTTGEWSLSWCDSDDRWHRDADARPSSDVGVLLDHVDADPSSFYWG